MSDEIVIVEVEPTSVDVLADTGTPIVTITDDTTGLVSVVDASPVVATLVDERPIVVVRTGSGGSMDLSSIMTMLTGRLTTGHMDPNLYSDFNMLRDLWARIGTDLLLTYPEGVAIQEAGRSYTTQSITDAVNDITVSTDGKIEANTTLVQQTELAITQSVNQFKQDTNGTFFTHDTRITQTAAEIASTVLALESTDGLVSLARSDIDQNATNIDLKVTQQQVDESGTIVTLGSRISLTEATIDLAVEAFDETTGRVSAAEIAIESNAITLSASSQYLSQKLETVQTILDNQWGVTVEEDINGNSYVAGFSLLLHPTWALGEGYDVDDTVYFYTDGADKAFECILTNIGDITNSPSNAIYWTEIPGGAKSVFTVNAEQFQVTGPNGGPVPLFLVDGVTNAVTINGALVVQLIKSDTWETRETTGDSAFKLDPETGLAEFVNMMMTFSNGTAKTDAQAALDIVPILFLWEGDEPINLQTTIVGADEWLFDGGLDGGCLIQLEIPDAFEGILDVALNGENLIVTDWESGSLIDEVAQVIDLNEEGETIDLGGLV